MDTLDGSQVYSEGFADGQYDHKYYRCHCGGRHHIDDFTSEHEFGVYMRGYHDGYDSVKES